MMNSVRKIIDGVYDITTYAHLPPDCEIPNFEWYALKREGDNGIIISTTNSMPEVKWNIDVKKESPRSTSKELVFTLPTPCPSPVFLTFQSDDPPTRLQQHIVQLYNQKQYSDLTAVDTKLSTQVIHLHSFVLDSHTDYFKALKSFKGEQATSFEVASKDWDATAAVLYFCYTGLLPQTNDWQTLMDTYTVAEMLLINSMLPLLADKVVPSAISNNALQQLVENFGNRWPIHKKIIDIKTSDKVIIECARCTEPAVFCSRHRNPYY